MADSAEARLYYDVASHIGKSVQEIRALPLEEIRGWAAYLAHRAKAQKKR